MGDRGVEPIEVLRYADKFKPEVDQLVRQAQMGLAARGTMAGANFRRHLVDERPYSLTVHYPGDFAELLQTSEDRLRTVADQLQRFDIWPNRLGRNPSTRRLSQCFWRRSREVGQPSPIAFGGFRVADVGMVRPGADLIVQNVASGAGGKP